MDNIRFDFDLIEDSQKKSETLFHIRSLLFSMGELYQRKEPAYTLKFTSLLYELLYLLVKDCQAQISSTKKAKNQMNHKRLTLIMDYVKEHYTEPISIKEASLLVSLNPEYFCRYFKKNMGITFLDYVNEVRMSHVYRDIMTTDLSITHILTLHGFTNYKLFLHMFREKYGCTPMQKRKQGTS